MSDQAVTDATITDFRGQNAEALESRAHPLHDQRLNELSALYEKRFAAPTEIVAPEGTALEYRQKHEAALFDRAHPEHEVRTQELTRLHERDDRVGGSEPGDILAPVSNPSEYDFSKFKATIQAPVGVELEQSPELEQQARNWLADGGLSKADGEAMANLYGQSLSWSPETVARIAEATGNGLRQKYGDNAGAVASAALRVAGETPGLLDFLESSNLISHWTVVSALISRAEAKGYFKKGN